MEPKREVPNRAELPLVPQMFPASGGIINFKGMLSEGLIRRFHIEMILIMLPTLAWALSSYPP